MFSKKNIIASKNNNKFYITIPFFMNNKASDNKCGLTIPYFIIKNDIEIEFEYEIW